MANTSTTTRAKANRKPGKTPEAETKAGVNAVKNAAMAARDKLETAAESARETGQETLKQVRQTSRQAYDDGSDMMRSAQSELEQAVRRNPNVAMLGALGLGVIIGLALRARS